MAEWLEQYRAPLFFGLIVLALVALILFQALRPQPHPLILDTATPLPTPEATATPRPLRVYVSGAVKLPDVYTLSPGSIVKDALAAAGGAADDADLDRINLALPVADGQHVYVPRLGEGSSPVEPPSGQPASSGRVNVNTADAATLESLPGIGPALAQRIVDYRQTHGRFSNIKDLMQVSGIGPSTFAKIQDLIVTD